MHVPIRCPFEDCPAHPIERLGLRPFFIRWGFYKARCRSHRVQRYRCKKCRRTFSRQTFRQDYRDRKPHLNPKLLELLAHGLGLRQAAIMLKMSRRCAEMKARKLSRHLQHFGRNMLDQLPDGCSLQMDEMETFETERRTLPVTVPVLIEQESMFVMDARSAPIRPSGRMSPQRRNAIRRREKAEGRRVSGSPGCVLRVLRQAAKYCKKLEGVRIDTDEKTTYPRLIRRAFGVRHMHRRTSSKEKRNTCNRLFPINHMNAMARYLAGRLRRRSWLASKRREFLDLHAHLFMAYMNFVRPRFNPDEKTPAMVLGLVDRRMKLSDVLSWRQDWGWFSPHPLRSHLSIRAARARDRAEGRASFQRPVEKRGYAD